MHDARRMVPVGNLQEEFGSIDIYLFDQLLKGRIRRDMRMLDAGCGSGRNLVHFFRNGYDICCVDESEQAIVATRRLASRLASQLPDENFRLEPLEAMSFPDASFDLVVCNAVLHFARDEEHWQEMLLGLWRVLRPDGLLFVRLASDTGIEQQVQPIEGRRFRLPDGSERFLVNEAMLLEATEHLDGELIEPLKTVIVHHMRSMTTWVMKKQSSQKP